MQNTGKICKKRKKKKTKMNREKLLELARPICFRETMASRIKEENTATVRRYLRYQNENVKTYEWETLSASKAEVNLMCHPKDKRSYKIKNELRYHKNEILYVREAWLRNEDNTYLYKIDTTEKEKNTLQWRSFLFMPKEAARFFVQVKGIRIERLQDMLANDKTIKENFAKEGIRQSCRECIYSDSKKNCGQLIHNHSCPLIDEYKKYWDEMVYGTIVDTDTRNMLKWNSNPWVAVYDLEKIEAE